MCSKSLLPTNSSSDRLTTVNREKLLIFQPIPLDLNRARLSQSNYCRAEARLFLPDCTYCGYVGLFVCSKLVVVSPDSAELIEPNWHKAKKEEKEEEEENEISNKPRGTNVEKLAWLGEEIYQRTNIYRFERLFSLSHSAKIGDSKNFTFSNKRNNHMPPFFSIISRIRIRCSVFYVESIWKHCFCSFNLVERKICFR